MDFLSKPLNLTMLYALLYGLISYTLLFNAQVKTTIVVGILILVVFTNFISHIKGTVSGMMYAMWANEINEINEINDENNKH